VLLGPRRRHHVEGRNPREELVSIRVELLLLLLLRGGRWRNRVHVRLSARLVPKIIISRWQGNVLTVSLGCHVHLSGFTTVKVAKMRKEKLRAISGRRCIRLN